MRTWVPIKLGPFVCAQTHLALRGKPTFAQAGEAGYWLREIHKASQFWLGDYYNLIRQVFPDRYSQLLETTGYDEHTLEKFGWVCRQIPVSRRRWVTLGVPWSIHEIVAPLAPKTQMKVLTAAHEQQLTVSDVRQRVRLMRRRPIAHGQGELAGTFRVVLADPDWGRMTVEEVGAVPVAAHLQPDAVVFLRHPETLRFEVAAILTAWDLTHKTGIIWDRVLSEGPHAYLSLRHEHLVIATRGHCPPDRPTPLYESVQTYRREPGMPLAEEFRHIIERLYDGPYLDLFPSGAPVDPWSQYGKKADPSARTERETRAESTASADQEGART